MVYRHLTDSPSSTSQRLAECPSILLDISIKISFDTFCNARRDIPMIHFTTTAQRQI